MKILYNDTNSKKDFKCFKEWYHIMYGNAQMKKNNLFGSVNFIGKNIVRLVIFTVLSILWKNIYLVEDKFNIFALFAVSICNFYILFYIFTLLGYFIHYRSFKKQNIDENKKKKNCLVIDEDGIVDTTDDIILSSKWNKLTHIFIGEYYIIIATTINILYIFPIDIKDRLISGVNKYNTNKELKIIEKDA